MRDLAVVLFSGGIDSTVALFLTRRHFDVVALTLHYDQRHSVEACSARMICAANGIEHVEHQLPIGSFGRSSLTDSFLTPRKGGAQPGVADTYVPARNTVFLAVAASFADAKGAKAIVLGANASDFEGYPDCRPDYFDAMRNVLALGTISKPDIQTPLVLLSKSEIVKLAHTNGIDLSDTWSCYDPQNDQHCGYCDACRGRRAAFATSGIADPTIYAT